MTAKTKSKKEFSKFENSFFYINILFDILRYLLYNKYAFKSIRDIGKVEIYKYSFFALPYLYSKAIFFGVNMVQLMDESLISRSLARITHEIIERNNNIDEICILGIKNRGIKIAQTLCENVKKFLGKTIPFGILDVTMFRDDFSAEYKKEKATENVFPCDLHDKVVIICDDVLYTGRTARAAIEAVFSVARPKSLQLAVLIDRGHREIPIRPDYVGKNIPTSKSEKISVVLNDDKEKGVYIISKENSKRI